MKYCPQCNTQYTEAWLTFCTQDGSLLREDLAPPADPNWDPRIRPTTYDDPSEQSTQWLPRDPSPGSGWMAPAEREPVERPWQPPAPPYQPQARSSPPPPGVAIASFIVGIIGVMMGLACAVPIPGLIAVLLGFLALSQLKKAPNSTGRGLAIAGIVLGAINLAFFVFAIFWFVLSLTFGW